MSDRPRPFARMLIACFFFVSAVTLNILLPRYWHNTPEIVKHLLLVFSAIMCVHIMEYAYLWWEIFGHIRNILKETLQATDPFFHQRLYSDFTHACDRLQSYPNVSATVRFYTHTPICWMMIVDNTAHFQPYTFGRSASKHQVGLCIGDNMPVFKFQMQPKGKPFEILEDHFLKLWQTSNLDLSNIETKIANRNTIMRNIFNSHSSWFKHVYEVLYTPEDNVPLVKLTNENSQVSTGNVTNY